MKKKLHIEDIKNHKIWDQGSYSTFIEQNSFILCTVIKNGGFFSKRVIELLGYTGMEISKEFFLSLIPKYHKIRFEAYNYAIETLLNDDESFRKSFKTTSIMLDFPIKMKKGKLVIIQSHIIGDDFDDLGFPKFIVTNCFITTQSFENYIPEKIKIQTQKKELISNFEQEIKRLVGIYLCDHPYFSDAELEICICIKEGFKTKTEIAKARNRSPETIKTQLTKLREKASKIAPELKNQEKLVLFLQNDRVI